MKIWLFLLLLTCILCIFSIPLTTMFVTNFTLQIVNNVSFIHRIDREGRVRQIWFSKKLSNWAHKPKIDIFWTGIMWEYWSNLQVTCLEATGIKVSIAFIEKCCSCPSKFYHYFYHEDCYLFEALNSHAMKLMEFRQTIIFFTFKVWAETACCDLYWKKNTRVYKILFQYLYRPFFRGTFRAISWESFY